MHGEICKCLFYFHLSSFCFSQTPQQSVLQHPTSTVHPQEAFTAPKQHGPSTGSSQGVKRPWGQEGCGHRALPGASPELLSCPTGQTQAVLWALGTRHQHPLLARRQVRGEHRRGRLQVTGWDWGTHTHRDTERQAHTHAQRQRERKGHSHTGVHTQRPHRHIPHINALHTHSAQTQQAWIRRETQTHSAQTLPTEQRQAHSTHTNTATQCTHTFTHSHTNCAHRTHSAHIADCRRAHIQHTHTIYADRALCTECISHTHTHTRGVCISHTQCVYFLLLSHWAVPKANPCSPSCLPSVFVWRCL